MKDETRGVRRGEQRRNAPNNPRFPNSDSRNVAAVIPDVDKAVQIQRSPLALSHDARDVLTKLLQTPISLTAGEVLGNSWELSTLLVDQIRPRLVNPSSMPQAVSHHVESDITNHDLAGSSAPLLRVSAKCGKKEIIAILDSGSEVNLLRKNVWDMLQGVPADMSELIVLSDASGGKTILTGYIKDLRLAIGGVVTEGNFWLTETCPPKIILGRGWHRRNLASVVERPEGTYLQFSNVDGDP